MSLLLHPVIRLLFAGQALFWGCSIIGITLTSLVGARLAPTALLATLPLALMVLGSLLTVQPLSAWMQRRGRRAGLQAGAACGVAAGLVCTAGVLGESFAMFCAGTLLLGGYQASAGFYSFAALDAVPRHQKGRAAAAVVAGGLCAAVFAPPLALWSRNLLPAPMAGAYLAIAVLAALAGVLLSRLPQSAAPARTPDASLPSATAATAATSAPESVAAPVHMRTLLARPGVRAAVGMAAIGHGLMVLVMNPTPLAMHVCGFSAASSAQVIQWHVVGMFLPALFSGRWVDRFGSRPVASVGALCLAASAAVALTGPTYGAFLASSLLLGTGWNLMVIAGTTLLSEHHSAEEKGQAQALMQLVNGATAAAMSLASGALISSTGWPTINLAMLPLVALATALLWLRQRPMATAA